MVITLISWPFLPTFHYLSLHPYGLHYLRLPTARLSTIKMRIRAIPLFYPITPHNLLITLLIPPATPHNHCSLCSTVIASPTYPAITLYSLQLQLFTTPSHYSNSFVLRLRLPALCKACSIWNAGNNRATRVPLFTTLVHSSYPVTLPYLLVISEPLHKV